MSDVFISHSSKDKEIADKVVEFLENKGLTCWIAPRDIIPGSDWAASISTAITTSKVFLVIYSENSAASEQCARELGIAENKKNVFVVPYKVDDAELTGTFEYFLTGAHWIAANYKMKDHKYEELFTLISGLTGKSVQNITNNTYIDELHIHGDTPGAAEFLNQAQHISGSLEQPKPAGFPAWIKKNAAIVGVSAVAFIAVAALIVVLVTNNKAAVPASSDAPAVTAAQTTAQTAAETTEEQTATKSAETSASLTDLQTHAAQPEYSGYEGDWAIYLNGGKPVEEYAVENVYSLDDCMATMTVKNGTAYFSSNSGSNSEKIIDNGGKGFYLENDPYNTYYEYDEANDTISYSFDFSGDGESSRDYSYVMKRGVYIFGEKSEGTVENFKTVYNEYAPVGTYTGELNSAGIPDGKGTFTGSYDREDEEDGNKNRKVTITGEFKSGTCDGTADIQVDFESGTVSNIDNVSMVKGKITGNARTVQRKANGDVWIYEGEYREGIMDGLFKENCSYSDGSTYTFEGEYKDNKKNGKGSYTYTGANPDSTGIIKKSYEGEYKDDTFNGQGKRRIYYQNGDEVIIEGTFENGVANGLCTAERTYAEPTSYDVTKNIIVGTFKDGVVADGEVKVTYYLSDGTVETEEGEYKDGDWVVHSTTRQ